MAKARINPIIEGRKVQYFWEGKQPPILAGDFNCWDAASGLTFTQVKAGLWHAKHDLPLNAYMEYTFLEGEKNLLDPLNPNKTNSGVGHWNNYFYMPQASPSVYAKNHHRTGKLSRATIVDEHGLIGGKRIVYFYRPPVEGPLPLLIVLDGVDYLRRGRIPQIVDSLVAAGKMQPVVLAMIQNAGTARFVEYACNDSFLFSMMANLIPYACEHFQAIDPRHSPGSCGILGASMGGTASVFAGLRAPQVFGRVLAQSGAFSMELGDFSAFPLIESSKQSPVKFWMDVGEFDFLLEDNRRMQQALRQAGHTVHYTEGSGGHNYTYWRNALPDGLQKLFPPLKRQ